MSLWNRTKIASVLMAIAMLVSALLDGFFSFNTIQFWFDHRYLVFVLYATLCLVAPLISRAVTVEGPGELRPLTVGIFLFGVAILVIATLIRVL